MVLVLHTWYLTGLSKKSVHLDTITFAIDTSLLLRSCLIHFCIALFLPLLAPW
jgi:hypothetical protein